MKQLQLPLVMSLIALFSSCKDKNIEPLDVSGNWSSEEIYVNGKLLGDDISKSTHLGLRKDQIFYKNYVVGKWSFENSKLHLLPNEDLSMRPLQFEVINLSDSTLTLQITLTESEYNWDFEDIEPNELITITEKYKKE